MIEIGKINTLLVQSEEEHSYILQDQDTGEELRMPFNLSDDSPVVGEPLAVFVYMNSENRLNATTSHPKAVVGEYALMRVRKLESFGAFMSWGINKDLLVPGNQQKIDMKLGEDYLVRVCLEEGADRVYGSTRLGSFIEDSEFDISEQDKVTIVPVQETDLGYRSIINKKYIGMIYYNEIFQRIKIESEYQGVVKKIRTDGLIDCALQTQGIKNLDESSLKILKVLRHNAGELSLHDKSPPEQIQNILGMSKKTFKSSIGMLYKRKKIIISKSGIKLLKNQ